jgi:uncharacterized protein
MARYRILSMDGGGIRGVLTARILERIDEMLPGFLSGVHLFAGTSTGGLLALGLGAGKSPKEMVELYRACSESVFTDSLLDNLKDLGNLVGAEYSWEPLKAVLECYFQGLRLAHLPKKVLVSAFDLDNEGGSGMRVWKMKFFHNFPSKGWDGRELLIDVALRTSVAPSYFPIYQGYIDGGVAASNPAMCALAQALHPSTGRQQLNDVVILSMGTGYNPHYLPVKDADWGLAQWAPHMLNIMLEGSAGMVDYQCRQVLDKRYLRINPLLPKPIGLGSVKYIPDLLEAADQVSLDEMLPWIKENFLCDC